jgi:hypothetical protein
MGWQAGGRRFALICAHENYCKWPCLPSESRKAICPISHELFHLIAHDNMDFTLRIVPVRAQISTSTIYEKTCEPAGLTGGRSGAEDPWPSRG